MGSNIMLYVLMGKPTPYIFTNNQLQSSSLIWEYHCYIQVLWYFWSIQQNPTTLLGCTICTSGKKLQGKEHGYFFFKLIFNTKILSYAFN